MQERRTANMSRSRFVQVEASCKEHLNCEGKLDRLPRVAAELVHRKLDLILTASEAGALAAKNATSTIPIVFAVAEDAVESGLVSSLARPGGNIPLISRPPSSDLEPPENRTCFSMFDVIRFFPLFRL
jgi:hypothetical protein